MCWICDSKGIDHIAKSFFTDVVDIADFDVMYVPPEWGWTVTVEYSETGEDATPFWYKQRRQENVRMNQYRLLHPEFGVMNLRIGIGMRSKRVVITCFEQGAVSESG